MNRKLIRYAAVAGASLLAIPLAACSETGADADSISVVFLAASSQNGYSQAVWEGVQERAAEIAEEQGITIDVKIQDGQFDATTQLSQLQNVDSGMQADGVVVVPNDGTALAAAFPLANSIPVATVLNPIGPDLSMMEPQVEGVVSTVASPPASGATLQAEAAAEYCADIDPCKIALLAGQLNTPLDNARVDAWNAVLEQHDNISVVTTLEGNYDRDQSLGTVSNLLQSHPDINGIISNADQQTLGAQIALENAGIDPSSVYLTGGGGTKEAVQAVLDGKWTNDFLNYPKSMGREALEQVINSVQGNEVTTVIDADSLGEFGPLVTRDDLEANPEFTGEWNG
ncbi:sugar ABC transporter substrate-binding protein [Gulosibacter sediminis]|uniref:sugar ABC transporter substrate-binding protein n=1 Tax=Gulosibacter sediminis TaxID=1729695 RepID=UPI0024A9384B|nr:sugar ABC transporter substrate-binding protein [Gulosibacter sediminis]